MKNTFLLINLNKLFMLIFSLTVISFLFLVAPPKSLAAHECPETFEPVTDTDLGGDVCIQQPPLTSIVAPDRCPRTRYIQPRDLCVTDRLPDSPDSGTDPGTDGNGLPDFLKVYPPLPESSAEAKGFTAENLVSKLIGDILPIVLGLAGFITVILIIVSGIQFIFSSGNPEAAAGARNRLIFALIGFAIIILAFAITQIVDKIFLGTGGTNFQLF